MVKGIEQLGSKFQMRRFGGRNNLLNRKIKILDSRADIILLDNMSPKQVARAVKICRKAKARVLLEASGGICRSQ